MSTSANSEDSDEMPHGEAFHLGLEVFTVCRYPE